jgi:hypothetical protein
MEYSKIVSLREEFIKLNEKKRGQAKQLVCLTNPIDKYNFFVKQYNIDYNKGDGEVMSRICGESLYSFSYIIQNRMFNFIIIFGLVPGMILLMKYYLFEGILFYIIFYSIYFGVIFLLCLLTIIIYCLAKRTYNINYRKVSNPFKRMIFHPDLCRLLNVNNHHVEYAYEKLPNLNLTEAQLEIIRSNPPNEMGLAKFMIYDQELIEFYSEIGKHHIFHIKHTIWLLTSIGLFILYIFLAIN